jgi:hypothetical protein
MCRSAPQPAMYGGRASAPARHLKVLGYSVAITAIETSRPCMSTGNDAPCRAGGRSRNYEIHSAFISAKSSGFRRMNVALTILSIELPAASSIDLTFTRL